MTAGGGSMPIFQNTYNRACCRRRKRTYIV